MSLYTYSEEHKMFLPLAQNFVNKFTGLTKYNTQMDVFLASKGGAYTEQKFDKIISGVELLEVISKTKPNTQGGVGEWGYNKSKLWVNRGLRANFRITFEEKVEEKDENISELKNKITALEKRILELEKPTKVEPNVESKYSSELTEEQTSKIQDVKNCSMVNFEVALLALRDQNWNADGAISVIGTPEFTERYKKQIDIANKEWTRRYYIHNQNPRFEHKEFTVNELDKLWQQEQKENTPEIICFCGKPAVHLRVVSNTRNKNRAYCSCKTRSCQFFSWKEGPVAQQSPHSNNIPYNPYN